MSSIRIGPLGQTLEEMEFAQAEWSKHGLHPELLTNLLSVDVLARRRKTQVAEIVEWAMGLNAGAPIKATVRAGEKSTGATPDDELQFERIDLVNFRQFKNVSIELKSHALAPVIVIEGKNGFGKSALVRAVRFALLGVKDGRDVSSFLHAACVGNQAEAKVILGLSSRSSGPIKIQRIRTYTRGSSGWIASHRDDDLVVTHGDQSFHGQDAAEWIREQFPEKLLDYFVFDAESSVVQALSGQRGDELPPVRDAAEAALAIQPLRELASICDEVASAAKKKVTAARKRAEENAAELRARVHDVEKLRRDVDEAQQHEEDLTRKLLQAQMEVDTYSGKGRPEQQRLRHGLLEEYERVSEQKRKAGRDLREVASRWLPLALLGLSIRPTPAPMGEGWTPEKRQGADHSIDAILTALEGGRFSWVRLPLPDRGTLLRSLREAVGLPSTDDQAKNRRREETLAPVRLPAEAARTTLRALVQSMDSNRWTDRLQKLQEDIDALACSQDESAWIDARLAAEAKKAPLETEVTAIRQRLATLQEQLRTAEAVLESCPDPSTEPDTTRRDGNVATLADSARQALTVIADQMLERRIGLLESEASLMLVRTAHKADVLAKLVIDRHTYRYQVLDKHGKPAPAERSTGERNLLALCLVHAIREAAGARLPMVIEAPLRVLDPEHRGAVLRELLAKCSAQMVLLITPDEIPSELGYLIRERVAQRFRMVQGKLGEQTDVLEC